MFNIAFRGMLLSSFLILHAHFASAEDIPPAANINSETKLPEGDTLNNCVFVTHDCELCTIAENDKVSCSSVGIACEPTKWTCMKAEIPVKERSDRKK